MNRWCYGLPLLPLAFALQVEASVSGYLEAGLEYDSNVNVEALNAASGRSDQARVLGAGLDASVQPLPMLNLATGYSYSARHYATQEAFDQDVHLAYVDLSVDMAAVTLGGTYHYSHARLGDERFLDLGRVGLYLGGMTDEVTYLRLGVQETRKTFDASPARDARVQGLSMDAFFFFNDAQSHVVLGLDGDDERAEDRAFDNQLYRVRARFSHRTEVSGLEHRLQVVWRYEHRRYSATETVPSEPGLFDPIFGGQSSRGTGARRDDAQIIDLSWRVGVTPGLGMEARFSAADYNSNHAAADYDKLTAALLLRAAF